MDPPVISLKYVIINLFAGEGFLRSLYSSRERILTQAREGKKGYYTFSYPKLGWAQYDHVSIETLFRLASARSSLILASIHLNEKNPKKLRLHAIAALLIRCQGLINKLFQETERARDNNYKPRLVSIVFENPFKNIFKTDKDSLTLDGEELIKLQDIGHRMNFTPFLPFQEDIKKSKIVKEEVDHE